MRTSSSLSSALTFFSTGSILSAGNLQAPFSSMCTISPGDTSMPPMFTGTLTACTAMSPWPAEAPLSRY